jgi:dipeptidyl aminopeptidase/acylaminoacyl peptidase
VTRPSSIAAALLLAGALPACNTEYDNPFARGDSGIPPPAAADVVFSSNAYATRGGSPRDLYAAEDGGANVTRLTFCNSEQARCDQVEAAPSPDRQRMAIRRVANDTDNDGRLTDADAQSLVFVDLARSVEAELIPANARVNGADWSPLNDFIIYSANGEGGLADIWIMDPNGQNNRNRTLSPGIAERRPRLNAAANSAVYERIDNTGKGKIYVFSAFQVTNGGPGSDPLPGTPYVVGSDADPDFSPDGRLVVFRRLTALGNGGLGTWDILTARTDGTELTTVASGPAYRGAPDWGPDGILFNEVDVAGGRSQLVLIDPAGTNRRTPITLGGGILISYPRWLQAR